MTIRRAFGLAAADLAGANESVRSRPLRTWATTSTVPRRPERSSVSPVDPVERPAADRDGADPLAPGQAQAELRRRGQALGQLDGGQHAAVASLERVRDRAEARRHPLDRDPLARAQPRPRRRERELEAARRTVGLAGLVHEHGAQRRQEGGVARAVRGQVHRAVVQAAERRHRGGLARHVRLGRHRHRERAVEAEDELVGLVVVGEEAGDVDPVDLVGAAGREDGIRVERVGARADDPHEPGAVTEQIAQRPTCLRALRPDQARRERVRGDEVPVAAEPCLGERPVRPLAVDQLGGEEEGAVRQPALRHADRPPQAALEPGGELAAPLGERGVAGLGPDTAHREQALPGDGLRVQPVDRVGDVRRVALAAEQAGATGRDLAAESLDVAAQLRRGLAHVRPVAREPVEERGADELLAHLPVRVRRRLPGQRGPQDRAGDAGLAPLGHHLRDVHSLRERELLVGVADAVAVGQRQVLDQQVARRVVHPLLGDRHLDALREPLAPVRDEAGPGGVVPSLVDREDPGAARVVEPARVDRRRAGGHAEDERAALRRP